jgi:site-specific recombinase XerD
LRRRRSEATIKAYRVEINKFSHFYRDQLKKSGPYANRLHETDLYAVIDYPRSTCYQSVSTINKAVSALHALAQYHCQGLRLRAYQYQ